MSGSSNKYQKLDYAPANFLRNLRQETRRKRSSIIKIVVGILAIAITVQLCVGPFGSLELIRMYQKQRQLKDRITNLSIELADLEWQTRQLSNPLFIEKLARERYFMHRAGEIIIKLPPDLLQRNDPS